MSDTREIAKKIAMGHIVAGRIAGSEVDNRREDLAVAIDEALRDERERCAKIADSLADEMRLIGQLTLYGDGKLVMAKMISDAIRNDKGVNNAE